MNDGKTVFAQLFEHIPMNDFRKAVRRYRGEYKVQKFSCLDQFLCMAFAQLTFRESLRDIETCLRTVRPKLYHMGIRGGISRTTLAKANENRDWRIYADFAQVLIRTARGACTSTIPLRWNWSRRCTPSTPRRSTCAFPFSRGRDSANGRPPSNSTPCWICGGTSPRSSRSPTGSGTTCVSSTNLFPNPDRIT